MKINFNALPLSLECLTYPTLLFCEETVSMFYTMELTKVVDEGLAVDTVYVGSSKGFNSVFFHQAT